MGWMSLFSALGQVRFPEIYLFLLILFRQGIDKSMPKKAMHFDRLLKHDSRLVFLSLRHN